MYSAFMLSLSARQKTLSRIGLRQWYGKYAFSNAAETPGALFSTQTVFEEPLKESIPKAPNVGLLVPELLAEVRPAVKYGHVQELISSSEQSVVDGDNCQEKPIIDRHVAFDKPAPDLTVSAISLGSIVVLFEQADSINESLEMSLLESIFNVVGGDDESFNQEKLSLTWPVFESNVFRSELSMYYILVIKRWLAFQDWSKCRHVFYFGESISSLEPHILELRLEKGLEYKVVHCDVSLAQILASPIKKKSLWALFSRIGVVSD